MLLRMLHVLSAQRQAVRQELESLRVKDIDARRTVEGWSLEMMTLFHVYLWWLIPRIVGGLVHPSDLHGISRVNPLITGVN